MKINKITPTEQSISFIIHLNNVCNFKCSYCIAWQQLSKEILSLEQIEEIINTIKLLRKNWDNRHISIDINWWEPTLHKNIIDIIKLFLEIDNLFLQVSTNLLRVSSLKDDFYKLDKINSNLFFNISYHYFEYSWKEEKFIESLKVLINKSINFKVKFLLPDNNIELDEFYKTKTFILNETWINENNCKYDLIIHNNWDISKSYSKSILDYFYNKRFN